MTRCFLLITLVWLSFSCTTKEKETEILEIPTLRASELYDFEKVREYIKKHQDKHVEIAKRYESLAEQIATENASKAIYYYKRSISVRPSYLVYQKLAKALVNAKKYDEASDVYNLITFERSYETSPNVYERGYIFEEPNDGVLYDKQITSLLARPVFYYVLDALNGVSDNEGNIDLDACASRKDKWLADERISSENDSVTIKMIHKVYNYLTKKENKQDKLQDLCRVIIKDTSSKFEISKATLAKFDYTQFQDEMGGDIESDEKCLPIYRTLLEETISNKDGWYYFNFNHLVTVSDSIVAIVYSIDTSATACPKEMRHIYHRLATYTPQGEIIDSKIVAWQAAEKLATMTFESGKFTVVESVRKWRNPYQKDNFDNYVLKTTEMGSKTFQIQSNGKIEEAPNL